MVTRIKLSGAKVPRISDQLIESMAEAAYEEFFEVHNSMCDAEGALEISKFSDMPDRYKIAQRSAMRAAYARVALAGGAMLSKA